MDAHLPDIRLELLEDVSPAHAPGFLRLVRRRLKAHYPDGTASEPFVYDEVDRRALDAVVVAAHYRASDGTRFVYLRSALRPPLVLRDRNRSPVPDLDPPGSIWELPAGLVETDEQSREGVKRCAARETEEELGFSLEASAFEELGPSVCPAPGFIAERHFFFVAEVDPAARREPGNDGSPLEHGGVVTAVSFEEARGLCRDGGFVDAKTELGVRRLLERFA
jgi:ADP-ribose pyrophosphatase